MTTVEPKSPQPWSLRQRGLRHNNELHEPQFSQCLDCWPGGVLCGRCGHMTAGGAHGKAEYRWDASRGWVLFVKGEPQPCLARIDDKHVGQGGRACGCVAGTAPREVVVDTGWAMLPGSSGQVSPAAFRSSGPSASGWSRRRRYE